MKYYIIKRKTNNNISFVISEKEKKLNYNNKHQLL